MSYHLYRNTTIGVCLQDTLDELIDKQLITPELAHDILVQFDKSINTALSKVKIKYNFRGSLSTYRFCDNVWTCVLTDVEFRDSPDALKVSKVKIVACDAKGSNE
ncbi:transcription initiation factor IIA subunit 2-like [Dysidea avara]|uniref:transcription initiation factor IIA subunit 2-like n=1 Tax=Dysidea avara TaxID=196820 RepID=UPI0033194D01